MLNFSYSHWFACDWWLLFVVWGNSNSNIKESHVLELNFAGDWWINFVVEWYNRVVRKQRFGVRYWMVI